MSTIYPSNISITPTDELKISSNQQNPVYTFNTNNYSDAYGVQRTLEPNYLLQANFYYGLNLDKFGTTGFSGTIDFEQACVKIDCELTGTTRPYYSIYAKTFYSARPGQSISQRFSAAFTQIDQPQIETYQFFGWSDNSRITGIFVRNDEFKISFDNGSYEEEVSSYSFNIDKLNGTGPSGINLNFTQLNTYEITRGSLGNDTIIFSIFNKVTNTFVPFHKAVLNEFPVSPIYIRPYAEVRGWVPENEEEVTLQGDEEEGLKKPCIRSAGLSIYIDGKEQFVGSPFSLTTKKENISNEEKSIVFLKNLTVVNSKTNFIDSKINSIHCATSGTYPTIVRIRKNAAVEGVDPPKQISGSVIEYDNTSDSIAPVSGTVIYSCILGKEETKSIILQDYNLHINYSENFLVSAESSGSTTVFVSVNWTENI